MLQVSDIHVYYGDSHVLQGVSLEVRPGEIVCLLGRNGAGKSTTMRGIIGVNPPQSRAGAVPGKMTLPANRLTIMSAGDWLSCPKTGGSSRG